MPSPDDEKFDPADLPELSASSEGGPGREDEDELRIPPPSEIATRINLLGKLIIPRAR